MLKLLTLFLPLVAFAGEAHFVAGCRILSRTGKMVMSAPGRTCAFLRDGRIVPLSESHLRLFESGGRVTWERAVAPRDSFFTLGPTQEKILIVSKKTGALPGGPANYHLTVVGLNGKEIRSTTTLSLFGPEKMVTLTDFREHGTGYDLSLYGDGLYSLTPELGLTGKKMILGKSHQVVNVQRTPDGNFFYLVRPELNDFTPAPVVYAEEFVPRSKRVRLRYPAPPSAGFYFPRGGSISLFGDLLVINHPLSGTYLVSRKTGALVDYVVDTHFDINQIRIPEEVTLTELSGFLERWKF